VDKQGSTYAAEELRRWKGEHEQWVRDRLREEVPEVGFAELEVVVAALVSGTTSASADFCLLDPGEKMRRNGLTEDVWFELTLGLSKAREVEDFVAHVAMRDAGFPERLKSGFVEEYRRQRADGIDGDALFYGVRDFAGRHPELRRQAAGLAVLAYLFEKCEVFES